MHYYWFLTEDLTFCTRNTKMNALIVLALLSCTFATGHAITCTQCMEMASDDPNFQPPADPNAPTCSSNPGEMVCEDGINSCMTTKMSMEFNRDSGPLTLMQTQRDCGPPAGSGLPAGDVCVSEQTIIDALTASLPDPGSLFPPELGLTFQNLDVSICLCDSADNCTPPAPSTDAGPQATDEPVANAEPVSTMKPTTPTSAAVSLVSSMALVLGSLLHVFLCRAM